MLYWTVIFLLVALVAALFGFGGVATGAASIAKMLFVLFLVLALVSGIVHLARGGEPLSDHTSYLVSMKMIERVQRPASPTAPSGWRDGPMPMLLIAAVGGEEDPAAGESNELNRRPSVNDGSFEDMGRIDGRSIDLDTMRPVYDEPRRERRPSPEWDAPSVA